MLTQLVQRITFEKLEQGVDLFVESLAFEILHQSEGLAVVQRDSIKLHLCEDAKAASVSRLQAASGWDHGTGIRSVVGRGAYGQGGWGTAGGIAASVG